MEENKEHHEDATDIQTKQYTFKEWVADNWLRTVIAASVLGILAIAAYGLITTNPDRANIVVIGILSVVSLLVVIVNAVSTGKMVRIMENQESEMTKQRQVAEYQLKEAERQATMAVAQAVYMRAGLEASQRQADISSKGLEHSERVFGITERPYLGLKRVHVIEEINSDQPDAVVQIEVVNVGRTPACDIMGTVKGFIRPTTPQIIMNEHVPKYHVMNITERIGVIPSGGSYRLRRTPMGFGVIPENGIAEITTSKTFWYVVAEIRYCSLQGDEYFFPFIAMYDVEDGTFFECQWDRSNTYWDDKTEKPDSQNQNPK